MSTVYLVPDPEFPGYDAVGFDATFDENHDFISTPSANPVESGSAPIDHIIHNPESFTCAVNTSNHPLRPTFFGDGAIQRVSVETRKAVGPVVTVATEQVQAFVLGRDGDLVREMLERLNALRLNGVVMSVLTSVFEYRSMLLVQITLPRGPKSIGVGRFSLGFAKFDQVATSTVTAPQPKEPRGKPMSPKGAQATSTFFEEVRNAMGIDPNKSFLAQLTGAGV